MCADTWVETYSVDDGCGIKPFHFGIRVEFVEIADTQGKVGIGEKFYGFGFFHTHK